MQNLLNKKFITAALAAGLVFHASASFARGKQDTAARPFFATGVNLFGQTSITKLVLSIDPFRHLRIEVRGSFDQDYLELPMTLNSGATAWYKSGSRSVFADGGVMGLYPMKKARLIGGARYGISKSWYQHVYSDPAGPIVDKTTEQISTVSGVLAAEYFLSSCFSIGAEFSVSYGKRVQTPGLWGGTDQTSSHTLAEGSITVRFYVF